LAVSAVRWAKKGTRGGKMLVGVMFLYPDQPPPNERIEQQIRCEKDSDSGDSVD
jgi:hypothetical protein